MSRHRIVIIGSGFAGLTAARRLKNADADITILARSRGLGHAPHMNGGQADRVHRLREVRRHRVAADEGTHPRRQVPAAALMLVEDCAHDRRYGEHHRDPVALDRVDDAARVERS